MSGTITDFWRMIWEHKPTTIVMLTKQVEGGKVHTLTVCVCRERERGRTHTYQSFDYVCMLYFIMVYGGVCRENVKYIGQRRSVVHLMLAQGYMFNTRN